MKTYVHGNEAMQRPPEKRKPLDVSKGFRNGPRRDRTCDPLIKSQLLYQLS